LRNVSIIVAVFIGVPLSILAASGMYSIIVGFKLYSYLLNNKYERWVWLTSFRSFGPGGVNPVRSIKYFFGDYDNDDETVQTIKLHSILALKISIISFILLCIGIVVVFLAFFD